ncbi:MAG: hypothetical protein WDO74_29010 [Pseudomonadota bacterium]
MRHLQTGLFAAVFGLFVATGCGGSDDKGKSESAGGSDAMGGADDAGAGEGGATSGQGEGGASESDGGSAAADAGSSGAGPTDGDPCQGVPTTGECVSQSQTRLCVVQTGNGTTSVVTRDCRSFEHCEQSDDGARCVLDTGACIPGQSECLDAKSGRACSDAAAWETTVCAVACKESAAGAFCVPAGATKAYTGKLVYQAFGPYSDYSDWGPQSQDLPGEGVLVLSMLGTDILDATLVGADGAFTLNVPASPAGAGQLTFLLLHPDPIAATAEFGIFDPDVPQGDVPAGQKLDGQVWFWSAKVSDYPSGTIRLDENHGSGAMHVYEWLRYTHQASTDFYGAAPHTLVAWMHLGTEWSCGTCFLSLPAEVQSFPFDTQMFISASAQDRAYWSDAVTAHEIGHFTMFSYGTASKEGGQHCVGNTTLAGQAWSEGWGTGFSSIVRDSPIYYDKQQGSMFWIDLGKRQYTNHPWQRPDPKAGLLQDIDENEVAAMLWGLAQSPDIGPSKTLAGLKAPSVTVPNFARGYTRHAWQMQNCERYGIVDTGESAPIFADYLDGLACAKVPSAAIDSVTNPSTSFPYPSKAPICP